MSSSMRTITLFGIMGGLLLAVGFLQSWTVSLGILNLCLISAIMSLGVNMQWGYAGLLNVGVMGFAALGGLAAVLVSHPPVPGAIAAGGSGILLSVLFFVITVAIMAIVYFRYKGPWRGWILALVGVVGYFITRAVFKPAIGAVEAVDPALTGFLGGLGLPIELSWLVGGAFAALAAWLVGKISLGLRSDYLAIATLGISEIIIAMLKFEDWLTRGVKNVNGLVRPLIVPYEVELVQSASFQTFAERLGMSHVDLASIVVKLSYALMFASVLIFVLYLSEKALKSPWGRMMRAIRDNETAAEAMGKDVKGRHLRVFILGSAVVGIAGAMLTTLDGQFTPSSYQPLRYTFLIWVMVIVGGSGNNWGAILGGFVVWFFWVEAEPLGKWLIEVATSGMDESSSFREHLLDSAAYMRLMTMGVVLLLVLRFSPKGLLPER